MNFFRCKVCGKFNDLDSDFCDVYHQRHRVNAKAAFHKWMERQTPLLDYEPSEEWEFSFLPLDQGGIFPCRT